MGANAEYQIKLKFDIEDEPPRIFITQDGVEIAEIFEEPILLTNEWSWNNNDWKVGCLTERVLAILNKQAEQYARPVNDTM